MGFGGSGGGGGALSSATDVALSNPANAESLVFDGATGKWKNSTVAGGGGSPTYANLPAGTTITVQKSGGTWPARPTSRSDIMVQWKGPDPSPVIVSSGTGGMLDNIDIRLVTP